MSSKKEIKKAERRAERLQKFTDAFADALTGATIAVRKMDSSDPFASTRPATGCTRRRRTICGRSLRAAARSSRSAAAGRRSGVPPTSVAVPRRTSMIVALAGIREGLA
jgi:hypothetical protein